MSSKLLNDAKKAAEQGTAPHQQLKKAGDHDRDPADVSNLTGDGAAAKPALRRKLTTPEPATPPPPPKPEDKVPFGSYMHPVLHRQFKAVCAWKGVEMQDALADAIAAWVKLNNT